MVAANSHLLRAVSAWSLLGRLDATLFKGSLNETLWCLMIVFVQVYTSVLMHEGLGRLGDDRILQYLRLQNGRVLNPLARWWWPVMHILLHFYVLLREKVAVAVWVFHVYSLSIVEFRRIGSFELRHFLLGRSHFTWCRDHWLTFLLLEPFLKIRSWTTKPRPDAGFGLLFLHKLLELVFEITLLLDYSFSWTLHFVVIVISLSITKVKVVFR